MLQSISLIDDVLRRRPWTTRTAVPGRTRAFCACVLLFGFMYGIAMGSYGGVGGDRVWQLLYSGLKVPLLLLATFFIGLPSFFVLNTLFGLRRDFREALRALVAAQAGVAIVLASCAPLTLFWYASFADYSAALLFNGLIFAVASFAGQFLLRGYYRPLTARNARHGPLLWTWLGLYVFIAIQMAWIMRPFVGTPAPRWNSSARATGRMPTWLWRDWFSMRYGGKRKSAACARSCCGRTPSTQHAMMNTCCGPCWRRCRKCSRSACWSRCRSACSPGLCCANPKGMVRISTPLGGVCRATQIRLFRTLQFFWTSSGRPPANLVYLTIMAYGADYPQAPVAQGIEQRFPNAEFTDCVHYRKTAQVSCFPAFATSLASSLFTIVSPEKPGVRVYVHPVCQTSVQALYPVWPLRPALVSAVPSIHRPRGFWGSAA